MPQQEGYIRWPSNQDIPLVLTLSDSAGQAAIGKTPQVSIRRYKETRGNLLDNYYWNATGQDFISTPVWYDMSEIDPAGSPGAYVYNFEQTLVGLEWTYHIYFRHTSDPIGFSFETHMITNEVYIPEVQPDPIIVGPTSVMGQLELVKALLHHNGMVDNQVYENGQLKSARLRMFNVASNIPATPGGSETSGLIAEFALESEYDVDGLNEKFVMRRVFP